MVYRKTEKVLAAMAEKRQAIIDACLFLMGQGMDAVTVPAVAERAGVAAGLIHTTYFPDKGEMMTAAVGHAAGLAVSEMRICTEGERYPLNALSSAIGGLYMHLRQRKRVMTLATFPAFRGALSRELARYVGAALPDLSEAECDLRGGMIFGAILGAFEVAGREACDDLVRFTLAGLGVARAARAMAAR